jgi:hypothetical protein
LIVVLDAGSTSLSRSAPLPGARVTSLCLAKEKSPRERTPRCCAFRPSLDEKLVRTGRPCRRALLGAAASGPDRPALTAAQGPQLRFDDGHRGLVRSKIEQTALSITRAGCVPNGAPRMRRAVGGNARRVAHRKCASSPQAHGCAAVEPRRARANPQHMDVRRAHPRGGLSLGHLSLTTQRKVARPPGRRTKKNRDVIPPKLRIDPLPLDGGVLVRETPRTAGAA